MNKFIAIALTLAASAGFACSAYAQDPAAGENVFKKCRTCHQIGETAKKCRRP